MKPVPYITAEIPNTHGCYIFRDGDVVLYVGMTTNYQKRFIVSNHRAIRWIEIFYPLATVEFVSCQIEQLRETESSLIKKLDPVLNRKNAFPCYANMSDVNLYKIRVYEHATRRISDVFKRITRYMNALEIPTD